MTDLETTLREHFDLRTVDLPTVGPGLDTVALSPGSTKPSSGLRSFALVAATVLIAVALGVLAIAGKRDAESVASPDATGPATSAAAARGPAALEPVETLPRTPDVSDTPATVAATQPVDWYRFAPDLDIAWYLDPRAQADISMFCWRTPATVEPQCFVDPLGATIVPLVVPVAGGQTVVLAGGDPSTPMLTVTFDDGTELEAPQDFDETIDWGVARFVVPPGRVITSVGGSTVIPPQTLGRYVPPILLGLIGLDLVDFEEQASGFGFETRVAQADGQATADSADYRTDRVNVVTSGGVVTDILPVG